MALKLKSEFPDAYCNLVHCLQVTLTTYKLHHHKAHVNYRLIRSSVIGQITRTGWLNWQKW